MPVLVTAFGPFGGRLENASSLALLELRKAVPDIRSRILPVDSILAPSRLKQAIRLIRPSALIMLGESASCREILLETTAWNEKSFGIPDIAGRSPMGVPVRHGAAESLASSLPLREIHSYLNARGNTVSFSEDAGRYLCNQLFYTALDYLETNSIRIPAGFIHLPLESDHPTTAVSATVAEIVRFLETSRKTLDGVQDKKVKLVG